MALPPCPSSLRTSGLFKVFCAALLCLAYSVLSPSPVNATSYQQCTLGTACSIGEFLYNDDYTLVTSGASCTFTARDPANNSYTAASGAASTDGNGRYYKSFSSNLSDTEGVYPTTMCCTVTPVSGPVQNLCLDKSFELKTAPASAPTAAQVADAVLDEPVADHTASGTLGGNSQNPSFTVSDIWNNPSRTLSSFGSLAGDVWSYSTRSLSTFGSLVTNIWSSPDRSLTEGGGTTTNTNNIDNSTNITNNANTTIQGAGSSQDIAGIKKQLDEQRKLLEALVNEPVIKSYIEEGTSPDLAAKISATRDAANTLYSNVQTVKTRLSVLINRWETLDKNSASSELKLLTAAVTTNGGNGKEDTSIVAVTKWLEDTWGNPVTTDASNLALAASANLKTAVTDTDYFGTTKESVAPLIDALANLDKLNTVVGDIGNTGSDPTLFGLLKKVQTRAQVLDDADKSLTGLMAAAPNLSAGELSARTDHQTESILAVNEFPYSMKILSNVKASAKNKLYALRALLDLNVSILASNPKNPVMSTWLEDGSVVFRTVMTNPSKVISQTVPLKYMLPKELQKDDIVDIDSSLHADYDPEKETMYVEGTYTLAPEEAVVVFVETKDIWLVSQEEMGQIRAKVDEYMANLKDSPLYAECVTLKGDIDKLLTEINASQESATTPADRIRKYRENQLKMLDIKGKLQDMNQLENQSQTSSSLQGFVGGSQAIVAWGLIAMFVAGFAFLTIYMKSLVPAVATKGKGSVSATVPTRISLMDTTPHVSYGTLFRRFALPIGIVVFAIVSAVVATLLIRSRKPALQAPVAVPEALTSPLPSPSVDPVPVADSANKMVLGRTAPLTKSITVPPGGSVNFRSGAGTSFPIVLSVKSTTTVYVFGVENDSDGLSWTHIGLSEGDGSRSWWVASSFVE